MENIQKKNIDLFKAFLDKEEENIKRTWSVTK